jgi:hypothetical protein
MKNYKTILLTSLCIVALNYSSISQAYDKWPRFMNWFFNSSPESPYESYLVQLRNDLQGIPTRDINSIIVLARKKLLLKNPENEYHINQLMRDAIVDQVRTITIDMAKNHTNNQKEIDASARSMVSNIKARLNRGENLNGLALKQFFDRDSLKHLVLQNIKNSHNRQTVYNKPSTYSSQPSYKPQIAIPITSIIYDLSNDDFLHQMRHDLKGVPESDINAIIAATRQEFLRKKPTNDYNKNSIAREAITNRVRMNTRIIANQLTHNATLVDNTVHSMSGNVKARLARGDNLNGQALQQFFGSSLEHMIKQNLNPHNPGNGNSPTSLPKEYTPSAPDQSAQEIINEDDECCVTFNGCTEEFGVENIPCKEGHKHSEKICSSCKLQLSSCPICRGNLRK